jgi:hypothetical protein
VIAMRVGVVLLGVAGLMLAADTSAVLASGAQQSLPTTPLVVVESFLAARNARDPFEATGWCAAMLEHLGWARVWRVIAPVRSV